MVCRFTSLEKEIAFVKENKKIFNDILIWIQINMIN